MNTRHKRRKSFFQRFRNRKKGWWLSPLLIAIPILFVILFIKHEIHLRTAAEDLTIAMAATTLIESPEDITVDVSDLRKIESSLGFRDAGDSYKFQAKIQWDGVNKGQITEEVDLAEWNDGVIRVGCDGCIPTNETTTDEKLDRYYHINEITWATQQYYTNDISKKEMKRVHEKAYKELYDLPAYKDKGGAHDLRMVAEHRLKDSPAPMFIPSRNSVEEEDVASTTESSQSQTENETASENEAVQKEEETAGNGFSLSDKTVRYQTDIQGTDGTYTLHIYSTNENTRTAETSWAGAQAGDTLHEGEYQTAVGRYGEGPITPSISLGNLMLNESQKNVYVIRGNPDLLVTSQVESSNFASIGLYVVQNGEVVEIRGEDGGDLYAMPGAIKRMPSGEIQIFTYNNAEGSWHTRDFSVSLTTKRLELNSWSTLSFESGQKIYQRFMNEPNFVYQEDEYVAQ
ncbi:hypothetical protein IMZ31_18995 (plasmid) [Pontibacillus sp. ALD_SL1]|uniref:hypothetical protein n=1 Tax=Pontibacillus sp. ALD_SL1 TaxID=2777185 RepID=UPI001A95FB77|nr:hypothetical protein [Pontibacillus sp. ALD_SL1]QST02637.1 hypothetical protein IMZ31_18995 [Pontibacillus sp. ALD_SL1]